ncbi:hypothetical protein G6011_09900 [Alternaria panax]|uniref:NACHT domain-containing protein n=1 Tax=Alternaria panax TaxID=48097 RepID=A0AAD4I642_9PLEO|nr:hypothetical protein G6011_09900 [Alternaria panax]
MSLIVSQVAPLKPTIRLTKAIEDFVAILPDAQKDAFHRLRAQAIATPPTTEDVMKTTTEIDKSQKAGERPLGPRFTKFLHGAQQFAAIGDVVVGSSQNVIACGVWTVVRMCLLAATNRSSYIENLSLLLMEAGQSNQQHSDLASLYPQSQNLQIYVIEYFIVVVHICLKFRKYAQKSVLAQFASSLNESDIKELRSNVLLWSERIEAEIRTLVAQRIETEAKRNSRFRALMGFNSASAFRQQKRIAFQNVLDHCSIYDYETTWRRIRKAGNTILYAELPEYSLWKAAPTSETLILVGKLGYGKSVTFANIVADIVDTLNARNEPEAAGLAYFFCQHDSHDSLVARTVIGTLVRQIISPLLQFFDGSEVARPYSIPQLLDLMGRIVPRNYAIYIVLDGLDLCSSTESKTITETFEAMKTRFNLHICVSLRLELEAELQPIATEFPTAKVVRLPDNTPDIEPVITAQLEDAVLKQKLVLGDTTIILKIHEALKEGAKGMFLWVVLQVESLCTMQTDEDILNALANLPQDLSQIYNHILQQAKRPGRSLQSDIFKLIIAARRPLTADEMREALSVTPGDTMWNPAKLINSIHSILATCGCLIIIDEEEHTIHTVHPSVNQFLLQDDAIISDRDDKVHFTMKDAQTLISSIIVTYLSYGIFGQELAVRLRVLDLGSAPSRTIESTIGTSKTAQILALLSRKRGRTNFDASKILAQELKPRQAVDADDFHFRAYATMFAMEHFSEFPILSCDVPEALFRRLKQDTICILTKDDTNCLLWLLLQPPGKQDIRHFFDHLYPEMTTGFTNEKGMSKVHPPWFSQLFYWLIATGRIDTIRYLLELYRPIFPKTFTTPGIVPIDSILTLEGVSNGSFKSDSDQRFEYRDQRNVLPLSLRQLCDDLWPFSLSEDLPSRTELSRFFFGPSPLCHAIENRQTSILELLIGYGLMEVKSADNAGFPPKAMLVAVEMGNLRAFKMLLSERPINKVGEASHLQSIAESQRLGSFVSFLEEYIETHNHAPNNSSRIDDTA